MISFFFLLFVILCSLRMKMELIRVMISRNYDEPCYVDGAKIICYFASTSEFALFYSVRIF